MRRLMRPALLLLLVAVVTLPAIADKAKSLYIQGQDAEARPKRANCRRQSPSFRRQWRLIPHRLSRSRS